MVRLCGKSNEPCKYQTFTFNEQKELDRLRSDLVEAITLLAYCVNYDNAPMTTAISGQLGEKIKEFIRRQENA